MDTNAHQQFQPLQQKTTCSHQRRTCWTFLRGCEAFAAMRCDCYLGKPRTQDTENNSRKREQNKGTILYQRLSESRRLYLKTGCATRFTYLWMQKTLHNRTCNGCLYGNRQNAIKCARANNNDLLRALKHLMEARL